MSKIKLNLKNLTAEKLITFVKQIVQNLTGNAYFPTTTPPIGEVDDAADKYQDSLVDEAAAKKNWIDKTEIAHQRRGTLELKTTQLGNDIENKSGGDAEKIKSSGMGVEAKPVRSDKVLPKPTGLAATTGDSDGEIDLNWDSEKGAKSYRIEICGDPIDKTKWVTVKTATKSKAAISGLVSRQCYWFRVCAINTNGESAMSDPASKVAP